MVDLKTSLQCSQCNHYGGGCTNVARWAATSGVKAQPLKMKQVALIHLRRWYDRMLRLKADPAYQRTGPKPLDEMYPPTIPLEWRDALRRVQKLQDGTRPIISSENFETVGKKVAQPKTKRNVGTRRATRAAAKGGSGRKGRSATSIAQPQKGKWYR